MKSAPAVISSQNFSRKLALHVEGLIKGKGVSPSVHRDLLRNFEDLSQNFEPIDLGLCLLAMATVERWQALSLFVQEELRQMNVDETILSECLELTSLVTMLNTYYKFQETFSTSADYQRIGLRHSADMNPQMGKLRFEMIAFSISVLNSCTLCLQSHHTKLVNIGVKPPQIHDLARLSAVVKGLATLVHS